MPKILVPIDFSPTSLNAAIYAAHFGKAIGASRLTMLSVVSDTITGDDGTPVGGDTDERDKAIMHQLEELQVSLYDMTGVPTSIELKAGEFSSLMEDFMRRHVFDFVVMGVTGSNAFEQVFGTSRAVEVIARSNTPVLIVPPMANFTKIEHAGLAVELHHVDEMLPFDVIDKWLHWLQPVVHIAHVNEHRSNTITDEEKAELKKLTDRFILFNPQTHLLHGEGFVDALNHMCVKQGIELLITFPQKHSFFNLLFRTSHTRQLVFYSKVPVLALPHSAES